MKKIHFIKIRRYVWAKIVRFSRGHSFYKFIYRSSWHSYLHHPKEKNGTNYLTSVPNRGAGIGHQLANWIAGYWFAKQFGLNFAHIPFSTQKWEDFLGFGEGEIRAEELIMNKGYKKIRLPLFNEASKQEITLIRNIIDSYQDEKVVFIVEQDQFYKDQYGVVEDIKRKFHYANLKRKDQLIYSKNEFNIAVHVRRGDIVRGQITKNPNLLLRWQNNDYFDKVLSSVTENLKPGKPIAIYLFSQGKRSDFQEFEKFKNINYCIDMDPQESFLHMVFADLLITSKSSFSYKPALLSNGIKICPRQFWHGYPKKKEWILTDDDGAFDLARLNICI